MLEPLYASTAVDIAPRTKLSRDSPSEILLINLQRKISKKTELSNSTSSQNSTSKCNTVSVVPFTPELSRLEEQLKEETEPLLKESKEMPPVKLLEPKTNDSIYN